VKREARHIVERIGYTVKVHKANAPGRNPLVIGGWLLRLLSGNNPLGMAQQEAGKRTAWANAASDLLITFLELLRHADDQEGGKNSCDHRKVSMGEYLFVDQGRRIRTVSREGMSNGRLQN